MSSNDSLSDSILDHIQHIQQVDETIYLVIQIVGGHVLLPILVLTILLSRKVKRHPVFINFCLSWILSSITYSLLLYRERSSDDLESLNPSPKACLAQASLLNGVEALTSFTSLALVIHLWMLLRSCISTDSECSLFKSERSKNLFTCGLLGAPFIVFVAFTVSTLLAGSPIAISSETGQPIPGSNLAIPNVFYCIILQNENFTTSLTPGLNIFRAVLIFSMLLSFITFSFEFLIILMVYKKRVYLTEKALNWPAMLLRVVLFSVYRTGTLGLNVAYVLNPVQIILVGVSESSLYNGVIDYVQAAIPLVAFVVFASEKDIISVWCFWRRDKNKTDNNSASVEVA